ncbi:MAG: cation-translocating P-type ATPase [Oscillospiraceae bacterium]|jgi:calcium-translocating P-type ATPase|nr:cation-translocating P-type ATPase [Oscillospiraceae bacterium]
MDFYKLSKEAVADKMDTDVFAGLTDSQVKSRVKKFGYNEFEKQVPESVFKKIFNQLKDISVIILLIAVLLSFVLAIREGHGFIEPFVILSIVIINVVLAISQEKSAQKAIDALSDLNSPVCVVIRGSTQKKISTAQVVPGDIILIKTGDLVPADARVVESTNLFIDESSLTGESETSGKNSNLISGENIPIGNQKNMVFSGCLVKAGHAKAVVIATGMKTQMGKIARFLSGTRQIRTPLQNRLDKIGKVISFVAVVSSVLFFIFGHIYGQDFWSMVLLAISLAVAAVPETLSLIVTLSLTQGIKNLAGKNILTRKLPAVETLGSVSVICSDKTGTITQNKMSIKKLWINNMPPVRDSDEFSPEYLEFVEKLILASNASIMAPKGKDIEIIGDPTEGAILSLGFRKKINKNDLQEKYIKVAEIPFSSERKMMTNIVKLPTNEYLLVCKGAFDRIPLNPETFDINTAKNIHDSFAKDSLRVIALASKVIKKLPDDDNFEKLENNLNFIGFIGLIDPPRPGVMSAVESAKRAGIRTVMITGDHAATAKAIAKELKIMTGDDKILTGQELSAISNEKLCETIQDYSVFARVSPEDKVRIVEAWQKNNEIVAMTGDGVNDTPALKAADVGIAMGKNGTEVAKSAADIVLTDDNFSTIVQAVKEGRNVYSNIKKTIYFLLTCNLSEIVIMLGAQIAGWNALVTPAMLLLINVLGDGIPGIHLAKEVSDSNIMNKKPVSRNESFFSEGFLGLIAWQTVIFSIITWAGYYFGAFVQLSSNIMPSHKLGQVMAFLITGWSSILHVLNVRSRKSTFKIGFRKNPMLSINAICMVIFFAVLVGVPQIASVFEFSKLGGWHWGICILFSLVPTVFSEVEKFFYQFKMNKKI